MPGGFTRVVEDFVCAHCGNSVLGDGYTNHCPACLYSLHVDVDPGDRACPCRGLMKPSGVTSRGGKWIVVHRCLECRAVRFNKASKGDSMERILELAQNPCAL
jgi:hypothetical protein